MKTKVGLNICQKGHYFFAEFNNCPFCKSGVKVTIPLRDGDCIYCGSDGVMCPGHAYGCNQPTPVNLKKYLKSKRIVS